MKINLGAGNDIKDGYINHDIRKHRDDIDITFNLNDKYWKIYQGGFLEDTDKKGNHFDEIRAWDVLEHLDSVIDFMNNCWDLLKEDGVLDIKVCGYQNESFHIDPTHKKGYHIKSFDYFIPGTELGKEYGYYSDKRWTIVTEPHYDRKGNVMVKLSPIKTIL